MLDKYRKTNNFHVPDGYFDGLQKEVFQRVEEEKKLDCILDERLRSSVPSAPDGYFAEMQKEVLQKVHAEQSRRLALRRRWIGITSAAASVALVAGIALFLRQNLGSSAVISEPTAQQPATGQPETPSESASEEISSEKTLDMGSALAYSEPAPKADSKSSRSMAQPDFYDEAAIGDFDESDLDGIDYELLDAYWDDCAYLDFWD